MSTIWADREDAFNAAVDAIDALQALQATETWQQLPLDIRKVLCRSHATLDAMTTAMVEEGVV